MADDADVANEIAEEHLARGLAVARAPFVTGRPGECEDCGEEWPRIVAGRCAPCRDRSARVARQS